jgi:hypothetical protein
MRLRCTQPQHIHFASPACVLLLVPYKDGGNVQGGAQAVSGPRAALHLCVFQFAS